MTGATPEARTARGLRAAILLVALALAGVVGFPVWRGARELAARRLEAETILSEFEPRLAQARDLRAREAAVETRRQELTRLDDRLRAYSSGASAGEEMARAAVSPGCETPGTAALAEELPASVEGLRIATWEITWDPAAPCYPAVLAAATAARPGPVLTLLRAEGTRRIARLRFPAASARPGLPAPFEPADTPADLEAARASLQGALASASGGNPLARLRARMELSAAAGTARERLSSADRFLATRGQALEEAARTLGAYAEWLVSLDAALRRETAPEGLAVVRVLEQVQPVAWTLEAREGAWRLLAEYAPKETEAALAAIPGFRVESASRRGRFLEAALGPGVAADGNP